MTEVEGVEMELFLGDEHVGKLKSASVELSEDDHEVLSDLGFGERGETVEGSFTAEWTPKVDDLVVFVKPVPSEPDGDGVWAEPGAEGRIVDVNDDGSEVRVRIDEHLAPTVRVSTSFVAPALLFKASVDGDEDDEELPRWQDLSELEKRAWHVVHQGLLHGPATGRIPNGYVLVDAEKLSKLEELLPDKVRLR